MGMGNGRLIIGVYGCKNELRLRERERERERERDKSKQHKL